jgi:hypothetical protein
MRPGVWDRITVPRRTSVVPRLSLLHDANDAVGGCHCVARDGRVEAVTSLRHRQARSPQA